MPAHLARRAVLRDVTLGIGDVTGRADIFDASAGTENIGTLCFEHRCCHCHAQRRDIEKQHRQNQAMGFSQTRKNRAGREGKHGAGF